MSSDYTGPITVVTFVGPKDRFAVTFHVNRDDPEQIQKITERYAEDGYKPDQSSVRHWFMVNGSIERERETGMPSLGYRVRSAFLKA